MYPTNIDTVTKWRISENHFFRIRKSCIHLIQFYVIINHVIYFEVLFIVICCTSCHSFNIRRKTFYFRWSQQCTQPKQNTHYYLWYSCLWPSRPFYWIELNIWDNNWFNYILQRLGMIGHQLTYFSCIKIIFSFRICCSNSTVDPNTMCYYDGNDICTVRYIWNIGHKSSSPWYNLSCRG